MQNVYDFTNPLNETNITPRNIIRLNLESEAVVVLACIGCLPAKNSSRIQLPLVTVLTEFISFINATPEYQTVLDKLGGAKWKDPLIDGTAAISMTFILVDHETDYHGTSLIYSLGVIFVTSLPRTVEFSSVVQLCHPFNLEVWILALIFVISVYVILEIIFYHKKQLNVSGQLSISYKHFCGGHSLRLNWFLTGYKTKLLEMVVLPYYIHPPTTFSELARSNYKIGILSYPKLTSDLNQSNSSIAKAIQRRYREYDFRIPDCYQQIFEETTACMGPTFSFDFIGITYMTDVRKQMLSQESRDTLFNELLSVGISKLHSHLIEPFNFVSSGMESGATTDLILEEISLRRGNAGDRVKNCLEVTRVTRK
ncbi:unnamed protein product [Allacma fusca]|uniref:Uncharacterized protein n=1 Tax=Allacma fusca TaxID=39272 RepID=A0A8J2KMS9_9HEXA|nr:unnamed protein product [Allacma fusca]